MDLQHACCIDRILVMQKVEPELQAATITVLRERGWDGLTLERVAEVAGRARTTLWRQGLTRDVLIGALVGGLAEDFRTSMFPVLTAGGTGRERLVLGLEALCDLLDRHLPLLLATDEAFHQAPAPGQPPDYLRPFITFLRDGAADGSLGAVRRRRRERRRALQRSRVALRAPARTPRMARRPGASPRRRARHGRNRTTKGDMR